MKRHVGCIAIGVFLASAGPAFAGEAYISQLKEGRASLGDFKALTTSALAAVALPIKPGSVVPPSPTVSPGINSSAVTQTGTNNFAAISQSGGNNASSVAQSGAGNRAIVSQR